MQKCLIFLKSSKWCEIKHVWRKMCQNRPEWRARSCSPGGRPCVLSRKCPFRRAVVLKRCLDVRSWKGMACNQSAEVRLFFFYDEKKMVEMMENDDILSRCDVKNIWENELFGRVLKQSCKIWLYTPIIYKTKINKEYGKRGVSIYRKSCRKS